MTFKLIDTHAHLDGPAFDEDREQTVERAHKAGVTKLINVGATDGFNGAERSLLMAEKFENVWISVGLHPCDQDTDFDLARLKAYSDHRKVVAIGETGLDFFRGTELKSKQYQTFEAQITLAQELRKPLIIHCRQAFPECFEVLSQNLQPGHAGGVFHCFDGDMKTYESIRELGFLISFTGIVTFSKSSALKEVILRATPDSFMVETDSPYLAPPPYRGKRCESAYVVEVAKEIAKQRTETIETVAAYTTKNAEELFSLPQD